jgi:hypothetical protein
MIVFQKFFARPTVEEPKQPNEEKIEASAFLPVCGTAIFRHEKYTLLNVETC